MLSTDEFKEFGKDYVLFAHVTTRLEGREHEDLLSQKGFSGFPSLAAMNADGDLIAKLTGGRDVEGFREMMAAGAQYEELRDKPEKTLDDEVFLLEHDVSMGNADVAAARTRADALDGLDEAQRARIDGLITDLEIKAALGQPRSREEAEELMEKAGATFAAMLAEGREPMSDQTAEPFYILILNHAEQAQDAELFERSLSRLRERFAENPNAQGFLEAADERLAKLRAPPEGEEAGDGEEGERKDESDEAGEHGHEGEEG